jgi:hypothetical protein
MRTPNFGKDRRMGSNLRGDGTFDERTIEYDDNIGHEGLDISQMYV